MDISEFRRHVEKNLNGREWLIINTVIGSGTFNQDAIEDVSNLFKQFEVELSGMIHGSPVPVEDQKWILGDNPTSEEATILLETCRRCSNYFNFTYKTFTTKVIVGRPAPDEKYHAISYVWGQTQNVRLQCQTCGTIILAPFESAEKFRRLMRLTDQSGEIIWLDALSIDQGSAKEKQELIGCMGTIYERAQSVRVFLPKSDEGAYRLLAYLAFTASNINQSPIATTSFTFKDDDSLTLICRIFNAFTDEFEEEVSNWTYWQRAWTFQEWALANNISLALDKNYFAGNFHNIKSSILQSATYLAAYKLKMHQYSEIDFGYSRGSVLPRFDAVKRLFPDERGFYCPELVKERDANMHILSATFNFAKALCLRHEVRHIESFPLQQLIDLDVALKGGAEERFLERFIYALRSLGVTRRNARHQADLIASWASMCNIQYEYETEDSFTTALSKVLEVIRVRGIKVYNFHISTSDLAVDAYFLVYASPQKQSNAGNAAYYHGLPILNGRADTLTYFRNLVRQPTKKEALAWNSGLRLREVVGAKIQSFTELSDFQDAISKLTFALSRLDSAGTSPFSDIRQSLFECLTTTPAQIVSQKLLIVVHIPARRPGETSGQGQGMYLWTICSKPEGNQPVKFIIGRESLNGCLCLAREIPDAKTLQPLTYLTLTDNISGTFLVPTTTNGDISLELNVPARGDMINSALSDGDITVRVDLEEGEGSSI